MKPTMVKAPEPAPAAAGPSTPPIDASALPPPTASALTLRALAWLLRYPDAAMRARLPEIHTALAAPRAGLAAPRRAALDALMDRLLADGLEAEAGYVDLFDRGRGTALHLFEHVHGDSRDRGPAMVDLVRHYEAAGLLLAPGELPDHLTVLLEYASTQPPRAARAFLAEFAHLVGAIADALERRDSDYGAVLGAVLDLAGGRPPLPGAAAPAPGPGLDDDWAEPPAFDGCARGGQLGPVGERGSPAADAPPGASRAGLPAGVSPVRLVRRPPSDAGSARPGKPH